jgi:hypothetical protein
VDTSAVFQVRLDRASADTITVTFFTLDGSAVAPGDYTSIPSGSVNFTPGQVQTQITVTIRGETLNEQNETFAVTLGSVTTGNAKIGTGTAVGTILNDDPQPSLSIGSPAPVQEGNSTIVTTPVSFPVTLSSASGQTVSVTFVTADGTAVATSGDYDTTTGTLVFNPGETQRFATVQVRGDVLGEPNETFLVQLQSPVNAGISASSATGTIADDEPRISINDIVLSEP